MKLYEIIIKPVSAFGTPLKGDTLFGCFCWQAAHDPELVNQGLDHWIDCYQEQPFVVFSSAYPLLDEPEGVTYALKRPDLPMAVLFADANGKSKYERLKQRKQNKRKKWLLAASGQPLDFSPKHLAGDRVLFDRYRKLLEDSGFKSAAKSEQQSVFCHELHAHNSINRLTQTTGQGFAPYSLPETWYVLGIKLVIFVLLDEEATDIERVVKGLARIGKWGFGRDASSGLGRFELGKQDEVTWPGVSDANGCYTLAPSVPEKDRYKKIFFAPFIRFGKHGEHLVKKNPFKNPVVMADEGAVLIPKKSHFPDQHYLGTGVSDLSKAMPQSVSQGYAIWLPCKVEV